MSTYRYDRTDCYITFEDGRVDAWDNNSGCEIQLRDEDNDRIRELANDPDNEESYDNLTRENEYEWHEIEHKYDLKIGEINNDTAPLLDENGVQQGLATFGEDTDSKIYKMFNDTYNIISIEIY